MNGHSRVMDSTNVGYLLHVPLDEDPGMTLRIDHEPVKREYCELQTGRTLSKKKENVGNFKSKH